MFKKRLTIPTLLLLLLAGLFVSVAEEHRVELPATPGQQLSVDLGSGGSLEIEGWNNAAVLIEGEVTGRNAADVDVVIGPTSDGVELRTSLEKKRRGSAISLEEASRWEVRAHFKIKVPENFDLKLDTMGGGIEIRGINGTITGRTMGGELELANLRGKIRLKTMGGQVRLVDSELDGKVTTMGGEVLFRNVTGDVRGSSMGGGVRYENSSAGGGSDEIRISSMGGKLELDEAPAGAHLSTMGGNIDVGIVKDHLYAKTMGGDIDVQEVDGSARLTTMAGDIHIRLVGDPGAKGVELTSYSGDITLEIPAGLDAEFEIEIAYTREYKGSADIDAPWALEVTRTDTWDHGHGSPRKYIRGTGTRGSGRSPIQIRTINGDVRIVER